MKNVLAAVGMAAVGAFLMAAGNQIVPQGQEQAYDWNCSINGASLNTFHGVLKAQDGIMMIESSEYLLAGTNLTCYRGNL